MTEQAPNDERTVSNNNQVSTSRFVSHMISLDPAYKKMFEYAGLVGSYAESVLVQSPSASPSQNISDIFGEVIYDEDVMFLFAYGFSIKVFIFAPMVPRRVSPCVVMDGKNTWMIRKSITALGGFIYDNVKPEAWLPGFTNKFVLVTGFEDGEPVGYTLTNVGRNEWSLDGFITGAATANLTMSEIIDSLLKGDLE